MKIKGSNTVEPMKHPVAPSPPIPPPDTPMEAYSEKSESKGEGLAIFALVMCTLLTILMTSGYLFLMYAEREHTLAEFGEEAWLIYVEFTPCWVSGFMFFCGLLYFICDSEGLRYLSKLNLQFEVLAHWRWTNLFSAYWTIGAPYAISIQILMILCRCVKQYLAVIPGGAACYCDLEDELPDPTLYVETVYMCQCLVPKTRGVAVVMTSDPMVLSAHVLQSNGYPYAGEVEYLTTANASTSNDVLWLKERPHFKMSLLILYMSVVVGALRLPVTALLTFIKQFSSGDASTRPGEARKLVTHTGTQALVLLASGIDTFAMIEYVMRTTHVFVNSRLLTDSVLACAGVTLILSNGVGMVSLKHQQRFTHISLVLTNLPMLAIRVYIQFWIEKNIASSEGAFFCLFIVKEAVLVISSVTELVVILIIDAKELKAKLKTRMAKRTKRKTKY